MYSGRCRVWGPLFFEPEKHCPGCICWLIERHIEGESQAVKEKKHNQQGKLPINDKNCRLPCFPETEPAGSTLESLPPACRHINPNTTPQSYVLLQAHTRLILATRSLSSSPLFSFFNSSGPHHHTTTKGFSHSCRPSIRPSNAHPQESSRIWACLASRSPRCEGGTTTGTSWSCC